MKYYRWQVTLGEEMEWLILIGAFVAAIILINNYQKKKRKEYLLAKYGDASVVEKIMRSLIWQGMSEEQLRDSWGAPVDIDEKVYKTKTASTYKYSQTGKNRFKSRVKVENGVVVGWEQK